jgi:hypothetical protein
MAQEARKQSTRLFFLFVYIGMLFVVNKLTFGTWSPESGEKGLWFYTAASSILMGNFLVTPFFTKPVDALSYSVMAGTGVYLVNSIGQWGLTDTVVFWLIISFIAFVLMSSLTSIATKDSQNENWRRVSATTMVFSNYLGNHRVIFSSVFLFALVVFHRQSPKEMFLLSITWATLVVIEPEKHIWNLIARIKSIWSTQEKITQIGKITAYQTPGIILIGQHEDVKTEFGTLIAFKDSHAAAKVGIVLGYVGRDETLLLRALKITVEGDADKEVKRLIKTISSNTVIRFEYFETNPTEKLKITQLNKLNELIGIIDQGSTIEKIEFEIINDTGLSEGRLVEAYIHGEPVIYQVIDGITREDILAQKNKYGYARGTALKIGKWDVSDKKFDPVKWMPIINSPVYLKSEKESTPEESTVGHFPKTDYNVRIKSVGELVTHNTAILGILGIGKSMLAIELVERMIAEKIKVICIDLTDQYAKEMPEFHDQKWAEQSVKKIQEAGQKQSDEFANNPQEGGSLPVLIEALENDIHDFIHKDDIHYFKVFNPSELTGTKQISEPKSYMENSAWQRSAPLWELTPVEITSLITEAALKFVQDRMSAEARVCLIFEEAHSLVPEWSSTADEGDKSATNRTARAILQGRKYGMGCLLITQRTANVTKTILNQCNSIFAMRTFDDTGKAFLSNYIGSEYSNKLSTLSARHAVYYGKSSSCENPVLLKLNDRNDFTAVFRKNRELPNFEIIKKVIEKPQNETIPVESIEPKIIDEKK